MKAFGFFGTMAGRLWVLLLVGITCSAGLALALSERQREVEVSRIRHERAVERMGDFLAILDRAPETMRRDLISAGVTGIRNATGSERREGPDPGLTKLLSSKWHLDARAQHVDPDSCFPPLVLDHPNARYDCWLVSAKLSDGSSLLLQVRSRIPQDDLSLNPRVVAIFAMLTATLAFAAARMAAAPLGELARAARALGGDLERSPLPESGPRELREAARAFNQMQTKLRSFVVERTQLLASITHDLQTPMTRLRLRLEKVPDTALRSRLIDDLGTMQALIREGLDYARSVESSEPLALLALDDLLQLVVDDAAVGNRSVKLLAASHCEVEVQPRALQRCLANLIDNALKYGGSAEVSAEYEGPEIVIVRIRDHGAGIPTMQLEDAFKPFARLQSDVTGRVEGVGLGLAIAKALAEKNNAVLSIRNHPDGGLEASLALKARPLAEEPPSARLVNNRLSGYREASADEPIGTDQH